MMTWQKFLTILMNYSTDLYEIYRICLAAQHIRPKFEQDRGETAINMGNLTSLVSRFKVTRNQIQAMLPIDITYRFPMQNLILTLTVMFA